MLPREVVHIARLTPHVVVTKIVDRLCAPASSATIGTGQASEDGSEWDGRGELTVQMKSPTTDRMLQTCSHMTDDACANDSVPTNVRFGSRAWSRA